MVCWVKLTGRLLVWKKRTVIASPSFYSPTCNPEWIACYQIAPPRNAGKVEFAAWRCIAPLSIDLHVSNPCSSLLSWRFNRFCGSKQRQSTKSVQ